MKKETMFTIEPAALEDAAELLAIYDHYVRDTAISFEYETPTEEEFRGRMENILRRYPYLVVRRDGRIWGYAYAGAFHARAAYDWCCETTIYLHKDAVKCGMGRALYEALEEALRRMGVLNLYAIVACPAAEDDEYVTRNSLDFHRHLGFAQVGLWHKCGYKFGRWYDVACMEKLIGSHAEDQPPVMPFAQDLNA